MSEKLCTLRTKGGGGGKYTETSLWTNPNPTSSYAGGSNITLSGSVDNYKYIMIRYRVSTSIATEMRDIVSVDDLKKSLATTNAPQWSFQARPSTSAYYERFIVYVDSTTVLIRPAYQLNASGTDNTVAIPLEILGLNELAHGHRMTETTLWTNPNPSSLYSNGTVTLSDDIDNYDYIKFTYKPWTTSSQIMSSLYPLSDVKLSVSGNSTNHSVMSMICNLSDNSNFARRVYYASDTSITFNASYQINASNSSANTNIPQQIIGCKLS